MLQKIVIRPLDAGWMVELERLDAPMVFKSGAQAERAARALAERLIDAGESAELIIHLRDGALAGRFGSVARWCCRDGTARRQQRRVLGVSCTVATRWKPPLRRAQTSRAAFGKVRP